MSTGPEMLSSSSSIAGIVARRGAYEHNVPPRIAAQPSRVARPEGNARRTREARCRLRRGRHRRRDGAAQHPRIGADRDARAVADGALRWSRWSRRWAPRTGGRGRTLLLLLALPALLAVPASPAAGARACL